jgi:hypothetical protein
MTLEIRRLVIVSTLMATLGGVGGWTATAEAQTTLACETTSQITFNDVRDVWPSWDPNSERITFNTFSIASNVPRQIGLVNADGSDYHAPATVPASPWGFFFPRWGPGNTIVGHEVNVFHEYMTFDVSQDPFIRTTLDGSDGAFTRELYIPGGGGGGWIVVSDDGSTTLWRWSSSGGTGLQQIRRGTFASLTGQAANATGTILQSVNVSPAQLWTHPVAISPDGTLYINQELGAGTTNANLVMRRTSDGALVRMVTDDASPSVSSSAADFSPDGTKIVFMRYTDGQWDLYVENVDGTDRVNITNTPATSETYPTWGPNGQRIALNIHDGTDEEIHVCTLNDVSANQPPEISLDTNPLVLEGNTTGGFTGTLSGVSASDPDGDTVTLINDAPALLPLGDTIVEWTASDGEDAVMANQTVTVQDTTAPVVTVPGSIVQMAASPAGQVVDFAVTATDVVDPAPTVVCSPASGAMFPIGTTLVTCTGEDASGNQGQASFNVTLTSGETSVFNQIIAGRAGAVKFSLGGDRGLAIFAPGYPASQQIDCETLDVVDPIEEPVPDGWSYLTYKVEKDMYSYAWKTQTTWAGTCRQLILRFNDGADRVAYFSFR